MGAIGGPGGGERLVAENREKGVGKEDVFIHTIHI